MWQHVWPQHVFTLHLNIHCCVWLKLKTVCSSLSSKHNWISSVRLVQLFYVYVYVYGSVHRWSILINVQQDTTQSSLFIILQVHSTCFGCQTHPSSGVNKTVTTASGTVQLLPTWPAWPRWREVAAQKIRPVPKAVVTVLCTPDDERCWHPKHVEWTCRIINRLLCVTSRLTIINIDQRCTEP